MAQSENSTYGESDQLTLELLLESLGDDVVRVVASPDGVDVPVDGIVIYDEAERSSILPGAIVLAVGVRPDTPESSTLMDAVIQSGAAAVVFKGWDDVAALARESASRRVALLSVPEEMTWTQLHAFLVNASRFSESSAAGGIAGVPLGDLFALSNAIAGAVGGAVTIEDPSRRVLAYSTIGEQPIDAARRGSILGRQVPDSPGIRTLYRMVFATDGVMTVDTPQLREILGGGPIDDHDLKPRSAVAIRAGSQAIGSIWIVHDDSELDVESEHSLLEAARIAAPHVIQARAARDVERRMRGEMLLAVLDGRGNAEETATRLGFSPTEPLSVVGFEVAGGEMAVDELQRERLVDLVMVHCEASCRQTASVAIGRTAYALLQDEGELGSARIGEIVRRIQAHAESRLGAALLAAMGSTAESAREVPRARREVERVLGVLRVDRKGRNLAGIDDVRGEVVLLELRELAAEQPSLTRGRLERILAHDAEHRSSYGETLRAYLDAFGDVGAAATRVSVHPNTFRYRMRRLVELFEVDLANPEERLVLELQLRLLAPEDARPLRHDGRSRRRS